jgi:hypothetical protein
MQPSKNPDKEAVRERLEKDIQMYLAQGGKIHRVPPGVSADTIRASKSYVVEQEYDDNKDLELLPVDDI